MRRVLLFLVVVFTAGAAAFWYLAFEHAPPAAVLAGVPEQAARRLAFTVNATDPNLPGLRRIEVLLRTSKGTVPLESRTLPKANPLGSGVRRLAVRIDQALDPQTVPEGSAEVVVRLASYARRFLPEREPRPVARQSLQIDHTPPWIELVSVTRNVRLGGSGVAVFRTGPDAVKSGVAVADYFFPATRIQDGDPTVAVSFFAVSQELPADVPVRLEAVDSAGNRRSTALPLRVHPQKFRTRRIEVSASFLQRKIPPLARENGIDTAGELLDVFLRVNRDLRAASERRIRSLVAKSAPRPLWNGPFLQQRGTKPMSRFADRRVYFYEGREIDRQTHLGYDLASVRRAPVHAAQRGVVVFAGPLGIYGTTVILDHGLGVSTLYAHLSSTAVSPGDRVDADAILGRTGETGLAGGDHLHFSVMVHGVHVDPTEWWDPRWLEDHVQAHLRPYFGPREASVAQPRDGGS